MVEQPKFRDPKLAKQVTQQIKDLAPKHQVKFCHVCGTHEWTITHYGLRTLLPKNVDVIAGPGCPVCIVPAAEIDEAVQLALRDVVVTCYGDVLRVPGSELSLLDARARGGDVRVVYGVGDAVKMANAEKEKEFVFFAVGFETTAPSTAVEVLNRPPRNLSFLVSHRLIPPAMELLLGVGDLQIDGFIAPGHVSTIIGLKPYEVFPSAYGMPVVVAGFEPLDVLFAISMLLNQLRRKEAKLDNEYVRAVSAEGNVKAQELINCVFDVVDGNWRGLGRLPSSALGLKLEFEEYDARKKYALHVEKSRDLLPGCLCHLVMIGKIKPDECPLFLKTCKPQSPKGACMVSMEGTCRIWARYQSAVSEGS
ncbi:MAG TPA: hydrogenase formation protein HypD [Candidatus Krumholzibacteriaceae bacterium]|jgi:hydrogenase expression/formation protein HypD|nr:hydrogenase formation protein HypD [Candidatus Krumholzibacteriaceae bacterium]